MLMAGSFSSQIGVHCGDGIAATLTSFDIMFLLGVSGESGADSELLANKEISFSFLDPLFMSGWDKKI